MSAARPPREVRGRKDQPCALCAGPPPRRESHIIPDFLYESIFDDKHRLTLRSAAGADHDETMQTGFVEYLLCSSCETKLSVWEGYVERFLRDGAGATGQMQGRIAIVRGVDYAKLRLFQLSILWRAGVTTHPYFKAVQLGAHEAVLRDMLLRGDPGGERDYPCLMFALMFGGTTFRGAVLQPAVIRVEGIRTYRFVFGGFIWAFMVSSHRVPATQVLPSVQVNGDLVFLEGDATELEDVPKFIAARSRARRQ